MLGKVIAKAVKGLDFRQEPHVEIFLANGRSVIVPLTLEEGRIVDKMDLCETLMLVDHILKEGFDNAVTEALGERSRKRLH